MTLFEQRLNELYSPELLKPGYAPFCKHLFIENFTDAVVGTLAITEENRSLLKTKYEARNERELPVLVRWFDKSDVQVHKARFLDIILYSYDQV